jgi:transcriptional regulator with XRE-family HTH domain
MEPREIFAKRLRILRKNKGYTQKELGALLNVTDAAVGMWEQARRLPDPEMLTHIAEVFDVSVDWLLGRITLTKIPQLDDSPPIDNNNKNKNQEALAAHRSDDPTQELPEGPAAVLKSLKTIS